MPALEEKRIVIKLPNLRWRSLFDYRFLVLFSLVIFASFFAYWFQNVRPYLKVASARIEAYSSIVNSDVAGRIVEMGPQEGDLVRKGQTLFVLDRDLLLAKQAQAKGVLDSLYEQIETEKGRIGQAMEAYLVASSELELGVGSQDQVKKQLALMDEAQEKTAEAVSKIGSAKTELSFLDLQLKKMTLAAPFDGMILKRSKNPGAVVSFGDPVYVLCDLSRMWIEAEISEREIGQIGIGTPARISLPAYPKKEFVGKVAYIGPATVAKSSFAPSSGQEAMIPVQISIESGNMALRPGLSAHVRLKVR